MSQYTLEMYHIPTAVSKGSGERRGREFLKRRTQLPGDVLRKAGWRGMLFSDALEKPFLGICCVPNLFWSWYPFYVKHLLTLYNNTL
eukprot:bmy_05035T0